MVTRAVGLSRDLPPKRVMRANVDERDIVVWRASDGTIAAWDNRCPHRGMALSHGFVRGTSLACLYHGWHFSSTGRCSHIPAHPDLDPPETIRTKAYSVVEAGGVIWVSATTEATAVVSDAIPLRSFVVDAPEPTLRRTILKVPFQSCMPSLARDGVFHVGDVVITFFTNPIRATTQATVLASKDINDVGLHALSRWCEAVRRAAEKEAMT